MRDDEITPTGVLVEGFRWLPVLIVTMAVLAALILGGWRAGWWFSNQNAGREAHQIRNGYSNQQSLREQITQQIGNVQAVTTQIAASTDPGLVTALKAQRMAIAAIVCQDVSEVTGDPLPAQQATWAAANCQAGNVAPGSSSYQIGTP
jgi:uncharacterized protein HemX